MATEYSASNFGRGLGKFFAQSFSSVQKFISNASKSDGFVPLRQPTIAKNTIRNIVHETNKDRAQKFLEMISKGKESLKDAISKVQEKIVDIKRELSAKSQDIKKLVSKIKLLESRVDKLQERLKKTQDRINELEAKSKLKELNPREKMELVELRKLQKEILSKLIELNMQIESERNRLKTLESKEAELNKELEPLEKEREEKLNKLKELEKLEKGTRETLGLEQKDKSREGDLTERYRKLIKEKYRLENPSQISQTHTAFRATVSKEGGFNFYRPTGEMSISNYGDEKFYLYKNEKPSLRAKFSGAQSRAGNYNTQHSRDNKEHGGKDNPSR